MVDHLKGAAHIGGAAGSALAIGRWWGFLKDTQFRERFKLQFRAEFANPFNRVVFSAPDSDLTDTAFGQIQSRSNSPRNIQTLA